MAELTWIFFGIFVVTCSAQFGYNPRYNPFSRESPSNRRGQNPLLGALQISDNDHKCFTLARRPFYMSRPMRYPCHRRMNGIPVVHSFMGPFGPMCVSYFREQVHRYYKIEMCCPGYTTDRDGKCSVRVGRNPPLRDQPNMMSMAAKMRNMMWLKARAAMARRRAMMMKFNQFRHMLPPRIRRPPISSLFDKLFDRPAPPFRRPSLPLPPPPLPLPRPVQRPPLGGRFVKLVRNPVRRPLIMSAIFRIPLSPTPFFGPPGQPPRRILSNQSPENEIRLQKFHPTEQPIPRPPRIPIPTDVQQGSEYPEEPDTTPQDTFFVSDGFQTSETRGMPDMHVDLPDKPVEMPQLIVEQAPPAEGEQTSCIVTLNAAVKSCLKQNNIDVPDVMSAFGSFNDEMSNILCERENAIFSCISETLNTCNTSQDAPIARDMLMETAGTVRNMCAHREMVVGQTEASQPDQVIMPASESNEATSISGADTMATVENVDAIPDVKPGAAPEQITVIEDKAPAAEEAIQQAIKHEVHVQEVEMKEFYLPLLIGSGVGFVILVLLTALLICCCCKRRLRKKMKMAKEAEKPPLKEIYTIGIAPPTYEVNGIPPMYYEEAKGEKITSGSPSVLEGSEDEAPKGEGTQM